MKALVLVGAIGWIISGMLPVQTVAGWLISILFAGVVGVIGYIILFEAFY